MPVCSSTTRRLIPVFNQGHQQAGHQQQALAMAVAAYAEHIDDPLC